jgi:hypothetical protein
MDICLKNKLMESEPRQFNIEKSPMKEAYEMLGATTPIELMNLYSKGENPSFISKEWDYDNPDQFQNKIKNILESVDEAELTEDEKESRDEILWFWYHHAISCADWKRDKEKMKEYSAKALEYQGNNPNILTKTMFLLAHDKIEDAEEWAESKEGDADYETALLLIENYKEHGFW